MLVHKMEVSKTETVAGKSQYVKVGEVDVYFPSLEECAGFVQGAKVTKTGDDGIPEYEGAEANWIMTAILSYAKANARNKLVSKSTELKDGLKIAETWAEFTAESGRSGEALTIMREARADFAEWIAKQGKSEAATKTLITLFNNRAALELQSATNKAKMLGYVESFAESLSEERLSRLQKPIENVLDACAESDAMDLG
jgi:hypothetical protein